MPKTKTDKSLTAGQVSAVLAELAPLRLAKAWDNVGFILGDPTVQVRRLLLTIDLTEQVVGEAVAAGSEMVMAYHPPIFKPLTRLTPAVAPGAFAALRAGVAVYSMHTALDAAEGGTNDALGEAIGLRELRPLAAARTEESCKVVVFVPPGAFSAVADAAFAAGAGRIGNYGECSFRAAGVGTFKALRGARPAVGRPGRRRHVEELRLELIAPRANAPAVLEAIRRAHPYETPAIDVFPLLAQEASAGDWRIGQLGRATTLSRFRRHVCRALGVGNAVLVGPEPRRPVRTIACCACSCGGDFQLAVAAGAQVYVTGEMRHHDALWAAAAGLTVLCVGHVNSERPVLPRLAEQIRRRLPRLAVRVSRIDTDPFRTV